MKAHFLRLRGKARRLIYGLASPPGCCPRMKFMQALGEIKIPSPLPLLKYIYAKVALCEPVLNTASERQISALSLTPAKDNWNQWSCCLTPTLAQVQRDAAEYPACELRHSGRRHGSQICSLPQWLSVKVSGPGASRWGQWGFKKINNNN